LATIYDIFEKAEAIEVLVAEIYAALAARFRDDPDARALFERLAAEELQHARRVRLLAARYRHDARLLEKVPAAGEGLDRLAAEAKAVRRAVEDGTFGVDLAAVKRLLSALESRFQDAHAELIAAAGPAELRTFFAALAEQDEAHARLLGDG
jgi:rubrerythrin